MRYKVDHKRDEESCIMHPADLKLQCKETLTIVAYGIRCQLRLLDALESGSSIQEARKFLRESLEQTQQAIDEIP